MFYARDMILAYVLSEFKLNPVINIPELQKFRNLDVKEMMTHRWSRSIWYHTKMVGDAMSNILKLTINIDFERQDDEQYYLDIFECGVDIVNRWMAMMAMQEWYVWGTPEHLRDANKRKDIIEKNCSERCNWRIIQVLTFNPDICRNIRTRMYMIVLFSLLSSHAQNQLSPTPHIYRI